MTPWFVFKRERGNDSGRIRYYNIMYQSHHQRSFLLDPHMTICWLLTTSVPRWVPDTVAVREWHFRWMISVVVHHRLWWLRLDDIILVVLHLELHVNIKIHMPWTYKNIKQTSLQHVEINDFKCELNPMLTKSMQVRVVVFTTSSRSRGLRRLTFVHTQLEEVYRNGVSIVS